MQGQWSYTVRKENDTLVGTLRRSGFETNSMLPPSHQLLYQNDGPIIPGRIVQGRVVEILPDVHIQFYSTQADEATSVEIETGGDYGPMLWRLERQQ